MGLVSDYLVISQDQTLASNNMFIFTMKTLFCVILAASYSAGADSDDIGSRKTVKAKESTSLRANEGTGRIYFTGPGYVVNLIPHALVLGLLGLALIFLYGESLFGSTTSDAVATGYGAPETGYGAPEAAYGAPEAAYGAPEPSYGAPAPSYDAPSTGYNAANRYYDERAANAASATN